MFKKMLSRLLKKIGYVRVEYVSMAKLEIQNLQKERQKLASQCERLAVAVNDLKNELIILKDENQSLWGMLDEMQGSSNFGKDQVKSIMKDIEEVLTDEMLKDFKPIGEA